LVIAFMVKTDKSGKADSILKKILPLDRKIDFFTNSKKVCQVFFTHYSIFIERHSDKYSKDTQKFEGLKNEYFID